MAFCYENSPALNLIKLDVPNFRSLLFSVQTVITDNYVKAARLKG